MMGQTLQAASPTSFRLAMLSLSRLPLACGIAILGLHGTASWSRWGMLVLCVLIEISDVADGFLARRFGVASDVGGLIDSGSDHVARLIELTTLAGLGFVYQAVVILVIMRDGYVWTVRVLSGLTVGGVVGTRWSGKVKGIAQGIGLTLLTFTFARCGGSVCEPAGIVIAAANSLIGVACIVSMADYVWSTRSILAAAFGGHGR